MGIKIYAVDAFTDRPFSGNPAAVCILTEPAEAAWMQNVAREMNLSETAFLYKEKEGFNLRWFTPAVEVDLCGHATLASAHILWQTGMLTPEEPARFFTRSGVLTAKSREAGIEMDFPATPDEPSETPSALDKALGATPIYVGKSKFDYLVGVESEKIVRDLQPDFGLLKAFSVRGFIVTSTASSSGFDFVSRFFAPGAGVDEDPVTGSAHCCLGPYWKRKMAKDTFTAYQASARGGVVQVRLAGDRVFLGGGAVTIWQGELMAS